MSMDAKICSKNIKTFVRKKTPTTFIVRITSLEERKEMRGDHGPYSCLYCFIFFKCARTNVAEHLLFNKTRW